MVKQHAEILATHLEWVAPPPMWDVDTPMRVPALLRFATDSFMDEFLATVDVDPARLKHLQAWPESWDRPPETPQLPKQASGAAARLLRRQLAKDAQDAKSVAKAADTTKPLKLFQPVHQRYYLVTACLVCRTIGLPDRRMASGDRASFVVRLLRTSGTGIPKLEESTEYRG